MSAKTASRSAIRGSICGCVWNVDTLAAAIHPRTSMPPNISTAPSIHSSALLSRAKPGSGVTWTNSRRVKSPRSLPAIQPDKDPMDDCKPYRQQHQVHANQYADDDQHEPTCYGEQRHNNQIEQCHENRKHRAPCPDWRDHV